MRTTSIAGQRRNAVKTQKVNEAASRVAKAILGEDADDTQVVCLIKDRDDGQLICVVDSVSVDGIVGLEDTLKEAGLDDYFEVEDAPVIQLKKALSMLSNHAHPVG